MSDYGAPSFKDNFHTKLKGRARSKTLDKKISTISALQQQYPDAGIELLSKTNRVRMIAIIQDLARKRVAQGGGQLKPFLGDTQLAQFFEDGLVTWIFDEDNVFHSVRIN